jgi:hypothetical protein
MEGNNLLAAMGRFQHMMQTLPPDDLKTIVPKVQETEKIFAATDEFAWMFGAHKPSFLASKDEKQKEERIVKRFWPVLIRIVASTALTSELNVFVSWTSVDKKHKDWFCIGDWPLMDLMVLCNAMKCSLPEMLKSQSFHVHKHSLPTKTAVWNKLLKDKQPAPHECGCQDCLPF